MAAATSLPSVSASVPWAQVLSPSLGCPCPPGLGLGQQNSPKEIRVRNENTPTPCPGDGRGRASAGAHRGAEPRAECGGICVGPPYHGVVHVMVTPSSEGDTGSGMGLEWVPGGPERSGVLTCQARGLRVQAGIPGWAGAPGFSCRDSRLLEAWG